jgi:hypothetical protein
VGGGVELDAHLFADGVVEGFAQGGADALQGRPAGLADAFHAGSDVGVVALPGDLDLDVAVDDGVEHGLDVAHAESVERDVPEVRVEVHP